MVSTVGYSVVQNRHWKPVVSGSERSSIIEPAELVDEDVSDMSGGVLVNNGKVKRGGESTDTI
jgi:hypothetical protein